MEPSKVVALDGAWLIRMGMPCQSYLSAELKQVASS